MASRTHAHRLLPATVIMRPDNIIDPCRYPTQVLCLDRKMESHPRKHRQAVFADTFARGCDGMVMSSQAAWHLPVTHPWCIRGMKLGRSVNYCWETNRTFYYIDNGYFGNSIKKTWFRIIKDHVHDIRPIISRDRERLDRCVGMKITSFYPGRKILIAPPSEKSLSLWDMNPEVWVKEVVTELKKHTDRPVEIRLKRPRQERMKVDTIEEALADDVHCLITYNSVAACEAVMLGKPAICLGPNAAGAVCGDDLAVVENPKKPSEAEREAWLRHLSYSQFTFQEMADGTAWRILNS